MLLYMYEAAIYKTLQANCSEEIILPNNPYN